MSGVQTSEVDKISDSGQEQQITVEAFDAMPSPPDNARDITQTTEDGKFVLRYSIIATGTIYQLTGSTSQEPLATHAMFKSDGSYPIDDEEWKKWKLWEADPHDVDLDGWKPDDNSTSDGMKKYYAYRNKGIEDYLLGTISMRVTSQENSEPGVSGLGRIQTPSGAPALEDGRTWLLVGVDAEIVNIAQNIWKVTRDYKASGAGGWDTDIYDHA